MSRSGAYGAGYDAGETDAAEAIRENGAVGDVRPESGLRESALESYVTNQESCDRDEYVDGYCAAWAEVSS